MVVSTKKKKSYTILKINALDFDLRESLYWIELDIVIQNLNVEIYIIALGKQS